MRIKDLGKTYEQCNADGMTKVKEYVEKDLAESLMNGAINGLKRSKKIENVFEHDSKDYSYIFVERYDILRKLIDALLLFDKVQISNHQCSNAYLCTNYPDLVIDWETLESMRLLRNDVNYKGRKLDQNIWNSHKPKFELCISIFLKEVNKRISEG